ncbi:MAG: PSD1 and planctomycete cytochrome C domain-containing protein [Planctomycetaceae bacterium]
MSSRSSVVVRACLVLGTILSGPVVWAADGGVDFTRDIRPLLSNRCFQCHGPDDETREADLRLDTKEGLFAGEGDEAILTAGHPETSKLLTRIASEDPDVVMPPPGSGYDRLTPDEVEMFRKWIAAGAEWEAHWAFEPPVRATPPTLEAAPAELSEWPRNEIDRFTLAAMLSRGLTPADEAAKTTLIRRVTYDLTGLPPTLAEVDAFLADDSPEAYERVVDRLLKSPAYGEHMARYWLDVARYGDTHGLHLDNVRSMWPYRDWLIQAFNANQPFDQMTIEQLAGDLLESPTLPQRVATGFNRCNVTTSEGGAIAEEWHVRYTVDRTETVSTVYMGLTLGCAVCHDHKFDPVTQKEFYGLYAFFNSFEENPMDGNALLPPPVIEVPTEEQTARRGEFQTQLTSARQELDDALAKIEYTDPQGEATAATLEPTEFAWIDDEAPAGASLQQDGSGWEFVAAPHPVFAGEKSTRRQADGRSQHFFTGAKEPLVVGSGDVLFAHVYLDPSNPPKQLMLQFNDGTWEHRAYWGESLIEWGNESSPSRLRLGELPATGQWVRLEVPVDQVGLAPGAKINGWAFTQFGGTLYWDRAGIVTRTPQAGQPFESQRVWELAVKESKDLPQPVRDVLKAEPEKRSEEQRGLLRRHFLEHVYPPSQQQLAPLLSTRNRLQQEVDQLNAAIAKTLIVKELAAPKDAFVLNRGEYDKPGDKVERQLPAVLPPLPAGAPVNRLGLAQWLVHPSHPLTARVTVNRWWQRLFGTGLVKTAEDFGIQGEAPSHPELLDWLAVEFVESGWDVKQMQKLIVMSSTYRQSSTVTPEKLQKDKFNRYLSRGPRFRLDAEMIRDTALAVSGLLNEQIGGESVKPYQPSGLWEAVGYTDSNTARFTQDDGEKLYRRSMYTFWKRTAHPPALAMFDAPSREACTVRRARTNTPLQALALMNDKQFVEANRHFAQRLLREAGESDEARLNWAFRLLTAREPTERELTVLRSLLESQQADFTANPASATALIDSATTLLKPLHLDRDKSHDVELATWTMLANLLMNLDEVITKG